MTAVEERCPSNVKIMWRGQEDWIARPAQTGLLSRRLKDCLGRHEDIIFDKRMPERMAFGNMNLLNTGCFIRIQ